VVRDARGSTASSVQYTLRWSARIEFSAFKTDERIFDSRAEESFHSPASSDAGKINEESKFTKMKEGA
jgi:hypothetical protein